MSTELQVTLTPEVAAIVVREAARQGTSADAVVNDAIRERLAPDPDTADAARPKNLAEAIAPYIGAVNSGGANMSEDCGKKFTEILLQKRQQGKL